MPLAMRVSSSESDCTASATGAWSPKVVAITATHARAQLHPTRPRPPDGALLLDGRLALFSERHAQPDGDRALRLEGAHRGRAVDRRRRLRRASHAQGVGREPARGEARHHAQAHAHDAHHARHAATFAQVRRPRQQRYAAPHRLVRTSASSRSRLLPRRPARRAAARPDDLRAPPARRRRAALRRPRPRGARARSAPSSPPRARASSPWARRGEPRRRRVGARHGLRRRPHAAGHAREGSAPRPAPRPQPAAHPGVELRCVTVAFDASLRAGVERAVHDAGGEAHATLSALRDALARAHGAMRAASLQTWSVDPAGAPAAFAQLAAAARARSLGAGRGRHRRRRGRDAPRGDPRPAAPALPPRVDAASTALDALVPPRPDKVAAAEAVWSPGALSHAAAGAAFPDLVALAASRSYAGPRSCVG